MDDSEQDYIDYIESLMPAQQIVMAKAALAGVRYVVHHDRRDVREPPAAGERWGRIRWVPYTRIQAFMPDGDEIGIFDDRYEAACYAVGRLETNESVGARDQRLENLFKVSE